MSVDCKIAKEVLHLLEIALSSSPEAAKASFDVAQLFEDYYKNCEFQNEMYTLSNKLNYLPAKAKIEAREPHTDDLIIPFFDNLFLKQDSDY